jgi:outer membrane protein OmpA-like peptidoglycan-associated protein
MKNSTLWLLAFTLCGFNQLFSQEDLQLTSKDSIVLSSWTVGLGYNFVDDSATPFGKYFLNIKETWHALPYPSSISLGRSFKNGIGLKAIGSYNRYKVGKLVDGKINTSPRNYYALDGMISYDLNKLIGETGWFDPFLHVGAGYTSIGGVKRSTANAGFGFNTWFNDQWGLNFNTMGKWGIPKGSTKQLQHSAGVVYRFGIEKGLSKKGAEKLALIDSLEKEKQRRQDSIAAVNRAKEEAALAERLAQERERARLAAAEQDRLDAHNQRKKDLQAEIDALGNIHFNFNSSSLTKSVKATLDQLAQIMANEPTLTLRINAHTDSRGPDQYNLGLSDRRGETTANYLISKGIDAQRLVVEGHGETELLNECDDHTYCSEAKHRVNRRSSFEVLDL